MQQTLGKVHRATNINSDHELMKLAAQGRDVGHWNYFFTLTSNNKTTPGLAPLRWAIDEYYRHDTDARDKVLQNMCGLFVRAWQRFAQLTVEEYLFKSDEKPLGDILGYWYRPENQSAGSPGNLPHFHGGLIFKDRQEDPDVTSKRISGIMEYFQVHHGCSFEELVKSGQFNSKEGYEEVEKLLRETMKHSCDNAQQRCKKKIINGEEHCRVPWHPYTQNQWTETPKYDLFSGNALKIMERIGLYKPANKDSPFSSVPEYMHPDLIARSFKYPNKNLNATAIPTVGKLAFFLRASSNVQRCDARFCSGYCLGYSCGESEERPVYLSKVKGETDIVNLEYEDLHNSKITSSHIFHKKENKKLGLKPICKEAPMPDLYWFNHDCPYVRTNFQHVHLNTEPYLSRTSMVRSPKCFSKVKKEIKDQDGIVLSIEIQTIKGRNDLPDDRQFTTHQVYHINDILESKYSVSNMSRFNIRPPELRAILNPRRYHRWFVKASPVSQFIIPSILENYPFVDGLGTIIKVRQQYLREVVAFYEKGCEGASEITIDTQICQLFSNLLKIDDDREFDNILYKRFVDRRNLNPVVIYYNYNPPVDADSFLLQILLKHGEYHCESELFQFRSLKKSFEYANLVANAECITKDEVDTILRRYLLEELFFQAFKAGKISKYLLLADEVLSGYLLKDNFNVGVPYVLERTIQVEAKESLKKAEESIKLKMLEKVKENAPNLPDNFTNFTYSKVDDNQTDDSLIEKNRVLLEIFKKIDFLFDQRTNSLKNALLVGGPGTGKSYMMQTFVAYSHSKGLRSLMMAYTSERAQALGGEHFHSVLRIPVLKFGTLAGPIEIVNKAVNCLYRNTEKFCIIKRTDILFFDEVGLLDTDSYSIMDRVFRKIKGIDKPFGGMLVIATGDFSQLRPINGSHVWLNNLMLTSTDVYYMRHYVRSVGDGDLQDCIEALRKTVYSRADFESVSRILRDRCKDNSKKSWDDVPLDVIRVVSKRVAVKIADDAYVQRMKALPGIQYYQSKSNDYKRARTNEGFQDVQNLDPIKAEITRECEDSALEEVFIFLGQKYQMTYNNNKARPNYPKFSQGQLVKITELPDPNEANLSKLIVKAVLLDAGCDLDAEPSADSPVIFIKRHDFPDFYLKNVLNTNVYRNQFPLRYNVATTIHRIIGKTTRKLATQITLKEVDPNYSLWEGEQFLTLFSRVRNLDDIIFVNEDFAQTIDAIEHSMKMKNSLTTYIEDRMSSLNILGDFEKRKQQIKPIPSKFFQSNFSLPLQDDCGYLALIVSLEMPGFFKIIECESIRTALFNLNKANSLNFEASLRPYTVVTFIYGFEGEGDSYTNFRERIALLRTLSEQMRYAKEIFGIDHFDWEIATHSIVFAFQSSCEFNNLDHCKLKIVMGPNQKKTYEDFDELFKKCASSFVYERYQEYKYFGPHTRASI